MLGARESPIAVQDREELRIRLLEMKDQKNRREYEMEQELQECTSSSDELGLTLDHTRNELNEETRKVLSRSRRKYE